MNTPRVALVVDHPQRDLLGAVLVALECARRGATCHLVPANIAPREVWALAPDFLLLNYFRRSNERLARGAMDTGMQVGLLDTEGGVWTDVGSYTELLWADAALRHAARGVCLWGNAMAHALVERGVFTAGQATVTGCPRFDAYDPAWRPAVMVDRSPARRPIILVNTNFSTVNPRFTTIQQKRETSRRNFGWSDERVDELLAIEQAAIAAVIDMVRRLASDLPGAEFRVRPHPFEREEPYRQALEGLPNVRVDGEGSVVAAICGATAVIQRSCTTAIEAGFAGIPTLSPRWVPAPFEMPAAEAVSVPCESYGELRDNLATMVAGECSTSERIRSAMASVTHDWFHRCDGQSYSRVADVVMRTICAGGGVSRAGCERRLYLDPEGVGLNASQWVASQLRHRLSLPPDWSFRQLRRATDDRWVATAKYFGAGEVRDIASRLLAAARAADIELGAMDLAVGLARERGECARGAHCHSVTLSARRDKGMAA